jgi:hypothetical protein
VPNILFRDRHASAWDDRDYATLHVDRPKAVLEGGGLRLFDRRARAEIPLAVVQEARTGGGRHVEIVLTDGAVHRVDARGWRQQSHGPRGKPTDCAPASRF